MSQRTVSSVPKEPRSIIDFASGDPRTQAPVRNEDKAGREELVSALRAEIVYHLDSLGLTRSERTQPDADNKEHIRAYHAAQRRDLRTRELAAIGKQVPKLLDHFADGQDVVPELIAPELVPVAAGTESGNLFRLASLLWSVPVSRGFGRRIRFLVRDGQNGKLIGILALGDPVFNLRDRDRWIGWSVRDREERLVHVMDAYVVGAVPPYSQLLGGKLVASLIGSKEITDVFESKYATRQGIISGQTKPGKLVLVTITSALGRSSVYNRLRLSGLIELQKIGETQGWGHFQVPDSAFGKMRQLLELDEHKYANGHHYGAGPNWRMRVIRAALKQIGLDENMLRHGISREIYGMPLCNDWRGFLRGEQAECVIARPSTKQISDACLARWIVPRAQRRPEYKTWSKLETARQLQLSFLPAPDET